MYKQLALKDSCESGNDKVYNIDLKLKGEMLMRLMFIKL